MRKGTKVTYDTPAGAKCTGIVRRAHRDGSVTVEAGLVLNNDGSVQPGWVGGTFRTTADILTERVYEAPHDDRGRRVRGYPSWETQSTYEIAMDGEMIKVDQS